MTFARPTFARQKERFNGTIGKTFLCNRKDRIPSCRGGGAGANDEGFNVKSRAEENLRDVNNRRKLCRENHDQPLTN